MSILPFPDPLPEKASSDSDGIHLSVLDSYTSKPGSLLGVSFWPRAGARLIDLVVHYMIGFCAGTIFGILVGLAAGLRHQGASMVLHGPRNPDSFLNAFLWFMFVGILGSIVFHAICEGFHGSTPGKLLLGFTVVQEDGLPCRFGPALIRAAAYLVDSLFFGMIGYSCMQKSAQEQRYGDEWAHTVVCRRSAVPAASLRGYGEFIAVFLLASMADTAVLMFGRLMFVMR